MLLVYERHHHPDPRFPIIFHFDTVSPETDIGHLHWHEGVELLYCVEGRGMVVIDSERISMSPGDIVVVNSESLHTVYSKSGCRYYCLITGPEHFAAHGIPLQDKALQSRVRDEKARNLMDGVVAEMSQRLALYQAAAQSAITTLFIYLFRGFTEINTLDIPSGQSSVRLVKELLSYIRHHFAEPITLDKLSAELGFSRHYVCHTFKKVTGQTVVAYINFVRCVNAKNLLALGVCNANESARQSGFTNLSYFSKTYSGILGELPSETYRRSKASKDT